MVSRKVRASLAALCIVIATFGAGCPKGFNLSNQTTQMKNMRERFDSIHAKLFVMAEKKLLPASFINHWNNDLKPVVDKTMHAWALEIDLYLALTESQDGVLTDAQLKDAEARMNALSTQLAAVVVEVIGVIANNRAGLGHDGQHMLNDLLITRQEIEKIRME